MSWLLAWWRALTGHHPDPSAAREQPDVLAVRQRQHDQLNRLAALELETQLFRRRGGSGA